MKFIHAADIHLDSPLCGLTRYEGAPLDLMRTATRRALVNLVDLACQEAVDFVLLAGDIYDGDWKDYNTGLFFNRQMGRLREAGIPVLMVRGNHDASNTITRQLRLPDNVIEFNAQSSETKILENLGVAVHGQSFIDKAVMVDLSAHYPPALSGYFNIGILHTALNGRAGHVPYAPCSISGLLSRGYDYWALGHVHTHEVLHQQPWIVFSGNTQGRHIRETGVKGCILVYLEQEQVRLTHCPLDILRWQFCELEMDSTAQISTLLDKAKTSIEQAVINAENRPVALRFLVTGHHSLYAQWQRYPDRWTNELRALATDVGIGNVWIEKIQVRMHSPGLGVLDERSPAGELLSTVRYLLQEKENLANLAGEFRALKQALPLEIQNDDEGFDPENPVIISELLQGIEELLLSRLLNDSTSNG